MIGKGFINKYDGTGYTKTIAIDMSDPNFFASTFRNEVLNQNWYSSDDDETLNVVIEFLIYNPNIDMLAKKNFVIEFLEAGPIINIEH